MGGHERKAPTDAWTRVRQGTVDGPFEHGMEGGGFGRGKEGGRKK